MSNESVHDGARSARRTFLSRVAMALGLAGGYGLFGGIAARYLYPARRDPGNWQFVATLDRLAMGDSLSYRAPTGETINVTRTAVTGAAADFIALSSVCPHLGCQVHWQAQNDRYFCPCHNGTFDAQGVGTGGPPGDAGQALPRYPLSVENGLVFIRVPTTALFVEAGGVGRERTRTT